MNGKLITFLKIIEFLLCTPSNFREEIGQSYYRNDPVKYDHRILKQLIINLNNFRFQIRPRQRVPPVEQEGRETSLRQREKGRRPRVRGHSGHQEEADGAHQVRLIYVLWW